MVHSCRPFPSNLGLNPQACVKLRNHVYVCAHGGVSRHLGKNQPALPPPTTASEEGLVSVLEDLTMGQRALQWKAEVTRNRLHLQKRKRSLLSPVETLDFLSAALNSVSEGAMLQTAGFWGSND